MEASEAAAPGLPLLLDDTYASPGALGRWLDASDLINAPEKGTLHLAFPRDWPAVFKQSASLKSLIKFCKGVRCRAINRTPNRSVADAADALDAAASIPLHPLHSFSNASKLVAALPGWRVVKGFAIFEQLNAPSAPSFVAVRHWWISSSNGTWIDLTPPLNMEESSTNEDAQQQSLLVESPLGEKREAPLTKEQQGFGVLLIGRMSSSDEPEIAAADNATGGVSKKEEEGLQAALAVVDVSDNTTAAAPSAPDASLVEQDPAKVDSVDAAAVAASGAAATAARTGEAAVDEKRAEADALFRNGDEQKAESRYKELVIPVVEGAVKDKDLGNAHFRDGEMEEANRRYEAALVALGLDPNRFNYFPDQAAAEYGRILRKATPEKLVHNLHSNRAACLLKLGRYEEAEQSATKALKERPNDLKARVRRASAYRGLGNYRDSATDYAHAMQLAAQGGDEAMAYEFAHTLTDVWCERAPDIVGYVAEVRAAAASAGRADGGGEEGSAAAVRSLERAFCNGLHGVGTPGEWARNGGLTGVGKKAASKSKKGDGSLQPKGYDEKGETEEEEPWREFLPRHYDDAQAIAAKASKKSRTRSAGGVDGALLLSTRSMVCLIHPAALDLANKEFPKTDHDGARCLLRLCAWIVGIRGSKHCEDACIDAMNLPVPSVWKKDHSISTFETLTGPEPCCIGLLLLCESLVRRRVSNLRKMDHMMEVLLRIFSFRGSARVRAICVSLLAWMARSEKARDYLFHGRYDENVLKPINTAMKDYCRLLGMEEDEWVLDANAPIFEAETGLCLGDGGFQSGIFGGLAGR